MTQKSVIVSEEEKAFEIIELANIEIEKLAGALSFLADVSEFATFLSPILPEEDKESVH